MFGNLVRRSALRWLALALLSSPVVAAPWFPLGPYGGDARSFAADPSDSRHLYLGTANGWLYESHDGGAAWKRVSQVGKRDDLVLDQILVDPTDARHLIVGTWQLARPDGGLYITHDGGKTWYQQAQVRGQSVRSLARSASNPKLIVAGTLEGVYRSTDNGVHWELISPAESKEIHEVESLAIDPVDPNIIYAGTWHLPWKTTDGGATWTNIKQGIIDDSDVFSIIIDPGKPQTVYLSACSGIYKSTDAAEQFRKIQGIPSTARRTRKLLQDPTSLDTVYAGTTEGLYKTLDGGRTFARMTDPNLVINDVYVDSANPNHVLLATDHSGVLSSEDGGTTFGGSNTGFSARFVSAFASDAHNVSTMYVGVVNDKGSGGVFQSTDGGLQWQQQSRGLGGRDVFSLITTATGTLLAGTAHGIFRFQDDRWADSSDLFGVAPADPAPSDTPANKPPVKTARATPGRNGTAIRNAAASRRPVPSGRPPHSRTLRRPTARTRSTFASRPSLLHVLQTIRRRTLSAKPAPPVRSAKPRTPVKKAAPVSAAPPLPAPPRLDTLVYALVSDGDMLYAGTASGLMRSAADGHAWQPVASLDMPEVHFVAAQRQMLLASSLTQLALSRDGAGTWSPIPTPEGLTQIAAVAVDERNTLWVGGREGVYYSPDGGASWKTLRNLFMRQVDGLYFDPAEHRVLVTSSISTFAFAVHAGDYKVSYWETGWPLRFARPVGDHLIAATLFDGMVLQPQMMDSPLAAAK